MIEIFLKTALRAIYVKDKYDIPKFNKIFENVFKKEARKKRFLMLNRESKSLQRNRT